jgi:LysR family transcriptional regulator of gallate degradation
MSTDQLGITDISLRHLKSALYVFEYKNVTRAANKLNRSQTAITKAIGELEAALNCSLFDRSSTGMMPTVHGEALAHRVRLAANEFDRAGLSYQQFVPGGRGYQSIPVFSMDISYKRLAAFIALYQTRDISEAARILGVTKAAVYNSVRQMEELLDLTLFEREPGGVAPTTYCGILARHTKLAFAEIRHALEDIASLDGITRGNVAIGTLPYTRTYLTPRAINRLLKAYPQLSVTTQEGPYSVLQAGLRSGDLDVIVGAVRTTEPGADIVTETLIEDRLAVIARKGHPLTTRKKISFRDLQDLEWVLPASETPSRLLFDETCRKHKMHTPEQAVQTSSQSMVRGLLLDSDRVALLSEHQIYYDRKAGLLEVLPVELEETYRPIGITLRAHTQPSPAALLFLDELRSVAKALKG